MAHHTADHIKIQLMEDGRQGIFIDSRHKDIIKDGRKLNQKQAFKDSVFDFADKRKGKGGTRNLKNLVFTHPTAGKIKIDLGAKGNLHVIDKNGNVQKIARINTALKGGMGADEGDNPLATRDKVIRSTKLETQGSAESQKSTRLRDFKVGTKNPAAGDAKGYTRWNKFIKGIIHHSGPARIISATLQKFEKINNPKWKPTDGLSKAGRRFARNIENRLGAHTVNSILNMDFYPSADIHNKAHRVLEDVGLDTKKINKTLNNLLKEVPKPKAQTTSKGKISTINPRTGRVEMVPDDPGARAVQSAKINKLYNFVKQSVVPGIEAVKKGVGDYSLRGHLTKKGAAAIEHNPQKLNLLINKNKITNPKGYMKPSTKPNLNPGVNLKNLRISPRGGSSGTSFNYLNIDNTSGSDSLYSIRSTQTRSGLREILPVPGEFLGLAN